MPQDADGSGLVSLLWGLWIYWTISSWCDHLSSQAKKDRRPTRPSSLSAISPLKGPPVPAVLDALMSEILRRSGDITVEDFVDDRLAAYEAIVAAFDAGDRRILRNLVSPEVYDTFSEAIAAKEARHETTETLFSSIEPPEILAARLFETQAEVSIRFVADSYKLSRNASGQPTGGVSERRRNSDVWTFGCTSSSPAQEWRLVAVEASVQ